MYLVTGGHRNGFICLLVCPWGESLQTGYDHIYPNPSQVACVLQQEITHFFFFGFWLLLMHFNCSQMPAKKKTLSAFNDQRNIQMPWVEELDDLVVTRWHRKWHEDRVSSATVSYLITRTSSWKALSTFMGGSLALVSIYVIWKAKQKQTIIPSYWIKQG